MQVSRDIKYNYKRQLSWAQLFNGPANADDFATALTIDNKDNVYITGASTGVGSGLDYTTIKYTPQGALQWTQRYNGTANGIDQPNDIAVDNNDNVYLTGLSAGVGTNFDIATVKYGQGTSPSNERTIICYKPTSEDEICFLYEGNINCDKLGTGACDCITFCKSELRVFNLDTVKATSDTIKNIVTSNNNIDASFKVVILATIDTLNRLIDDFFKKDSAIILAGINVNSKEILNIFNSIEKDEKKAVDGITNAFSIMQKIIEDIERGKKVSQSQKNNLIKKLENAKTLINNMITEIEKIEIDNSITIREEILNGKISIFSFDSTTNQEFLIFTINQ